MCTKKKIKHTIKTNPHSLAEFPNLHRSAPARELMDTRNQHASRCSAPCASNLVTNRTYRPASASPPPATSSSATSHPSDSYGDTSPDRLPPLGTPRWIDGVVPTALLVGRHSSYELSPS